VGAPAVVLVRPRLPANLGSIARVAKNFGVSDLRLVEPAAAADEEASRLASGADDVQSRSLSLAELPAFLSSGGGGPLAFVFGPERSGLTEEERSHASASLRLPTQPGFPTMNISHAVAVVLAVAGGFRREEMPGGEPAPLAPAAEIEAAIAHWDRALEAIGFYDTGHRQRSLRDWRGLIAGRPLSVRDVAMLRGVANRVLVSLRRNRT
jgi:tRNA C32,U32 (ribose-2'-O)-methylase TrmJ